MADEHMNKVFGRLQPICVKLAGEHTRENVHVLSQALSDTTDCALGHLQEYILFPLRLILKGPARKNTNLCIDVVNCLNIIFSKTSLDKHDILKDLFNSLCMLISGPPGITITNRPEELKVAVVECMLAVLKSSSSESLFHIYQLDFLPSLGHAVTNFLTLLTDEKYPKLRVLAAQCLLQVVIAKPEDAQLKAKIGDSLSSFLPGITMATTRVITADEKQSHAVTSYAIKVWIQTVVVVMGDENIVSDDENISPGKKCSSKLDADLAERLSALQVTRSADWVKNTADKLGILIDRICTIAIHPKWQVRMTMVKWSQTLITKCDKSLPGSTGKALDILVQLAADEYDAVAKKSQEALASIKTHYGETGSSKLTTILEENLYDLATQFPRFMRSGDDQKKLSALILFSGYIKLLGQQICCVLNSAPHLQRITMALIIVLEFDSSQIELVQEVQSGISISLEESTEKVKYYFRHFHDERILDKIKHICRCLGYYGDVETLVDHLLGVTHQSPAYKKQAFFMINEVIHGTKGYGLDNSTGCNMDNQSLLQNLISYLLEIYLSPVNWDMTTSQENDMDESTLGNNNAVIATHENTAIQKFDVDMSLLEKTQKIIQICILLDGIAISAKVLQEDFHPHLINILYHLMEKVGSHIAVIHNTALASSDEVAVACGYANLQEMLCNNSDYLVNSLYLRLRHVEDHPMNLRVLHALLHHTNADILPLFEDIVQELLLVLEDNFGSIAICFMQVLYTLAQAIIKIRPQNNSTEDMQANKRDEFDDIHHGPTPPKMSRLSSTNEQDNICYSTDIVSFLKDYHKTHMAAEGNFDKPEEQTENIDDLAENDEIIHSDTKKEKPKHILIAIKIMERCSHLLSSPEVEMRLLALRTSALCCIILKDEQDELLPIAHKLWSPFVARFKDDSPLVSLEAIYTLKVLGETTGDFLWRRVSSEVLPPMADFLTKQAATSLGKKENHRYTILGKLQLAVISSLGVVCDKIHLKECLLYRVAVPCLPYLSGKQPKYLQNAAVEVFHVFRRLDSDTTWLVLNDISSDGQLPDSESDLSPCLSSTDRKKESCDNIDLIKVLL